MSTRTVAFVHGNFVTRRCWEMFVPFFEARGYYTVIAGPGWEEVANYAQTWIERTVGKPAVQVVDRAREEQLANPQYRDRGGSDRPFGKEARL